jgi:hypothetical protein
MAENKCHDVLLNLESTLASNLIQYTGSLRYAILNRNAAACTSENLASKHSALVGNAQFAKRTTKARRIWQNALRRLEGALERIRTFAGEKVSLALQPAVHCHAYL